MNKSFYKNKGYSLIEMVIVIAIIAILAAMAMVSVTIIHSARAKDSALKLDAEIAECITRCKNMDTNVVAPAPNSKPYDGYAIAIYKNNAKDKFIIAPVYYSESGGITGSGHYSPIYNIDNPSANADQRQESIIQVPSSVSMTFKGTTMTNTGTETVSTVYSTDTAPKSDGPNWVYIRFDKKGNCISGYGEYKFYKKNGNVVARVILRQNGSHEVR